MWSLACLFAVLSVGKVVFVLEVCRHGSRAPTVLGFCPWDSDGRWGNLAGELTSVGMRMHFLLGSELRQRYIFNEPLLNSSYDATEVYFRTTDLNRTIMSAQSQIMGLFPASTGPLLATTLNDVAVPPIAVQNGQKIIQGLNGKALPNQFQTYPIHVFPYLDDFVLLPNAACSALYHWSPTEEQYMKAAASNPWFIETLMPYFPDLKAEDIEGAIDLIIDDIYCSQAMGFPLPNFPAGFYENATNVFNQIFSLPYQSDVNARLYSSWFFLDLLSHLEAVLAGTEPTKFRLYSAHDTTVAGILAGLQVFDNKQPPFASSLIFEVSLTDDGYFMHVLYNDHPLILPMCLVDPCPLNTFMTFIKLRAYASTDVCVFNQFINWSETSKAESDSGIKPKKGSSDLKWVAWAAVALCAVGVLVALSACIASCRRKQWVYEHIDDFERSAGMEKKKIINATSDP